MSQQPIDHEQWAYSCKKVLFPVAIYLFYTTALIVPTTDTVTPALSPKTSGFSATGALVIFTPDIPRLVCVGTLVAPDIVLTAAHCLRPSRHQQPTFVLSGRVSDATPDKGYRSSRIEMHPQFVARTGDQIPLHDLALVQLAEPVPSVAPEKLLSRAEASSVSIGAAVEIVGYGRTALTDQGWGVKNTARSSLVDAREFEWVIGGPSDHQSCDGDSGGPAFVRVAGERRLMGIVSRALDPKSPCSNGTIHSRVDAEAAWLVPAINRLHHSEDSCSTHGGTPKPELAAVLVLAWAYLRSRRRYRRMRSSRK